MYEASYIDNTYQAFKKIMSGHFYDVHRLNRNGQKSESFAVNFEHHFKYTTSHMDVCKYMDSNLLK